MSLTIMAVHVSFVQIWALPWEVMIYAHVESLSDTIREKVIHFATLFAPSRDQCMVTRYVVYYGKV